MSRQLSPEELEARKAALERYNQAFNAAHGYFPGAIPLNRARRTGYEQKGVESATKLAAQTPEQWRNGVVHRYKLRPLTEVQASYDVTDPTRYQRPPAVQHPAGVPLVRNVKRNGDDPEEKGIEPAEFKQWRTDYLGMTAEELAAILRVTPRTIRNWEAGKSPIPFMLYWAVQHIKPSDLPTGYNPSQPTKYYKPVIQNHGSRALASILHRYRYIMKEHGISAADFEMWRKSFMMMSQEQMGQLLRVPPETIQAWEDGRKPIPFSVWWAMHTMMQDPEVFLSRPGFHDLYIEYHDGESLLCSRRHPEIRFTPTDLYLARSAMKSVESLNSQLARKEKEIADLQAENTRLRQMMKAGTVAAELKAMHDHIGQLMKQVHTADVLEFQGKEAADVIPLKKASA